MRHCQIIFKYAVSRANHAWLGKFFYGLSNAPIFGVFVNQKVQNLDEGTQNKKSDAVPEPSNTHYNAYIMHSEKEILKTQILYAKSLLYISGASRLSRDWIAGSASLLSPSEELVQTIMSHPGDPTDVIAFKDHINILFAHAHHSNTNSPKNDISFTLPLPSTSNSSESSILNNDKKMVPEAESLGLQNSKTIKNDFNRFPNLQTKVNIENSNIICNRDNESSQYSDLINKSNLAETHLSPSTSEKAVVDQKGSLITENTLNSSVVIFRCLIYDSVKCATYRRGPLKKSYLNHIMKCAEVFGIPESFVHETHWIVKGENHLTAEKFRALEQPCYE